MSKETKQGLTPLVVSVNVGRPREVERGGQPVQTSIWKTPASGRVRAAGVNLEGDEQADRQAHGGPDKAIYAYAIEDTRWWEAELGRSIDLGGFGENLTTEGIDLAAAVVGERWSVGTTVLEVSEPRVPCWKLNLRMDDRGFLKRFSASTRPGTYLRIITEGHIEASDAIEILSTPDHGLSVGEIYRIYLHDRKASKRLLHVAELSEAWRAWAQREVQKGP